MLSEFLNETNEPVRNKRAQWKVSCNQAQGTDCVKEARIKTTILVYFQQINIPDMKIFVKFQMVKIVYPGCDFTVK